MTSSLSFYESEKAALVEDVGLENFSRQRPASSQSASFTYTKRSTVTRQESVISREPVITEQPTPQQPPRTLTFDTSKFDSVSAQLYSGLSVVHKAPEKVTYEIRATGQDLAKQVSNSQATLTDNLSYDDLLRTLVHDNETVLTRDWRLKYREARFVDCEGPNALVQTVLQTMPSGTAILTDQRLLLMSAQLHSGFSLSAVGAGKPRRYTLQATVTDNLHFKPIPLDRFRSIEMYASIGAHASSQIVAFDPCCWGWCKCFAGCFAEAVKRWGHYGTSLLSLGHNKRTIELGLLLPPWGRKCMLYLELEPDMRLSLARDFIALLQKHHRLAS